MKLTTDPRLGDTSSQSEFIRTAVFKITTLFRETANQVNNLSAGYIDATDALTSAPTTGKHKQGDFVRNSTPTELGATGSKYVVLGWVCVTSGIAGGSWKECRVLTGG